MSKLNPVAREFYPQAATVSINRLPQSHSTHTTIGFLNICSLRYKIDTLSALIRERTWDVVGIAETWLDASIADGELNIEGYSLVRNDRKGRKGGGVCIFYRSYLPIKPRPDLNQGDTEVVWVELNGKAGNHLIGCIYRPPDAPVSYWSTLEASLHQAAMVTSAVTLMGDFNVNISHSQPQHAQPLLDLCGAYGLTNIVHSVTRVSPRCPAGTTIDLILTTEDKDLHDCRVLPLTLSDHFGVEATFNARHARPDIPKQRVRRRLDNIDLVAFRLDLAAAELHVYPPDSDVQAMWDHWHQRFLSVLDRHAPLQQCKIKTGKLHPPWSDRELYKINQLKRRLHRKWLADKANSEAHAAYRRARSVAANTNRCKRNQYFQSQCQDNCQNPRKLWSVLNTVTGRKRQSIQPTCDIEHVASTFGKVVSDDARPSVLSMPQGPQPRSALTSFQHVRVCDAEQLLKRIDPRKATGSDGIPGLLLKYCADLLAPSVAALFNASLTSGTVPAGFKRAYVTPLHKAGDPSVANNFRPVSLLPILSKLLEKVVQKALVTFLDMAGSLPSTQFAFRTGHSTEDALVLMVNRILASRDRRMFTGVVLLDMSKAFDKVRHQQLVEDLFCVGVTGTALQWLMSYLSDRCQIVQLGSQLSTVAACSCGVPQGSVLGPLLFSLYTRDIPSVAQQAESIQFADDIALTCSRPTQQELTATLSRAVTCIADWLKQRGLILNASKSQALVVPAGKLEAQPELDIIMVSCD
eukprot:scpid33098/ scgid15864/ Probable RNA-directed DNA polymerase from transposon X-element; Reverse transcriptase